MADKYRTKPMIVTAMQFTGTEENHDELVAWVGKNVLVFDQSRSPERWVSQVHIPTLEGMMTGRVGWWIIRGLKGEHYPCEPDIFDLTYERVVSNFEEGV